MDEFDEIEEKHKIIINKAVEEMKKIGDPKHSLVHTKDVVAYAKEILQSEEEANKEVVIVSAYWHDVGRIAGSKGHALLSANMLKEELEKMNYDSKFIELCYLATYKHGWNEIPETLEGIIVRDADKIDFVGVNRWRTCKENGCRFRDVLELLPTLRSDLLQLESSRKIYDREIAKLVEYLHDEVFMRKISAKV